MDTGVFDFSYSTNTAMMEETVINLIMVLFWGLLLLFTTTPVEGFAPVAIQPRAPLAESVSHPRFRLRAQVDGNEEEDSSLSSPSNIPPIHQEVDIAIVGAGIGGLSAGAILNTLYGKKIGVFESHYLPGGCAHAFERTAKTKDKDGVGTKALCHLCRLCFDSMQGIFPKYSENIRDNLEKKDRYMI